MNARLTIAALALLVAAPLSAQTKSNHHPPIPRTPHRREAANAPPRWEPHRRGIVPYVRNDHWYGNPSPDDRRFRLAHPFAHGRFAHYGPTYLYPVVRVDLAARRFWLRGGFVFVVASWDWPYTAPWCWDCDEFVLYLDPDHPGWYLLYDVRLGEYVHVLYMGAG